MSKPSQPNRGGRRESSERKVSAVEAAYVVESYLIEKKFTKTLTEFRSEAAPIFSSLKTVPAAVKSLSEILQQYLVLREEHQSCRQEKSKIEQALREEQTIVFQERNRIQLLVQQIHESLSLYQSVGLRQIPPAGPPMSSSPTQPVPLLKVGYSTPPGDGIGPGLTRTPSSARAPNVTSGANKRKNNLTSKSVDGVSLNTTGMTAASKKARQHILPTGSPQVVQPSPPWPMCGTVRKTSLNMVRTVQSNSPRHVLPRAHHPKSHFSNPSLPVPQTHTHEGSPIIKSKSLPSDVQNGSRDPPVPAPSNVDVDNTGAEDSCNPDPRTPPRDNSNQSPQHPLPESICTQDGNADLKCPISPGIQHSKDFRRSAPPALDQTTSPTQPSDGRLRNSTGGEGKDLARNPSTTDQCSPDIHQTCAGTRGMKPSRTMRPLDFSGIYRSTEGTSSLSSSFLHYESPVSEESLENPRSPECDSPNRSDDKDSLHVGETVPHLSADLESIDDILACLDDASFSELVGNILTNDCSMDAITCPQSDKIRSVIGEDSFGFDCMVDISDCQDAPLANSVLSEKDVNTITPSNASLNINTQSPSKRSLLQPGVEDDKSRRVPDKENVLNGNL